ncbi:MAG: hypothetical protein R3282_06195, partial [Rhodothermales bacterium]|nr:hypothetical protein [Rhodothermales bacterium]
ADFLRRYDVSVAEYERHGVFLLRSTLMNPWYGLSENRGRDLLVELVDELYSKGDKAWAAVSQESGAAVI